MYCWPSGLINTVSELHLCSVYESQGEAITNCKVTYHTASRIGCLTKARQWIGMPGNKSQWHAMPAR
jgi:hypothetical protein